MSYNALIIGAGMSGLAAAIRLAMFGKKVVILESHFAPGGLNSYYARGNRSFDVGLHALTNYIDKSSKGRPLNKLLKQLRIPYDQLDLEPQRQSHIHFDHHQLHFSNNFELLQEEIALRFPDEIDGFCQLVKFIEEFDETNLSNPFTLSKPVISHYIKDEDLLEMLYCPLLIYGSALPHDMDLSQFVIMFKSIYLEGFSRPKGGVRKIIDILLHRAANLGVEIRYRSKVTRIISKNKKFVEVEIENGERLSADQLYSSAGLPETLELLEEKSELPFEVGEMSFCESILCTKNLPETQGAKDTIIFFNKGKKYHYAPSLDFFDPRSAVICFPQNFGEEKLSSNVEGMIRFTFMANFKLWDKLRQTDLAAYKEKKEEVAQAGISLLKEIYPQGDFSYNFKDVFTPSSIKRYTGHFAGTVYGSPKKVRDGRTDIENLYIIGTDQGFLGIVGALLSGISLSNLYGLSGEI